MHETIAAGHASRFGLETAGIKWQRKLQSGAT
jgi:hypothetical protein